MSKAEQLYKNDGSKTPISPIIDNVDESILDDSISISKLYPSTRKIINDSYTEVSKKQDKLNPNQLAAVDSGITSAKVSTYDNYANTKQDKLESKVNIKTINNQSILGGGNIEIQSSTGGSGVQLSAPASATNGTLSSGQLATLQESDSNYIIFNNEIYRLEDKSHTADTYTYIHVGYENNKHYIKSISITISTLAWVLNISTVNDGKASGGVITVVDNLPIANKLEYDKHNLYLNNNELYYMKSNYIYQYMCNIINNFNVEYTRTSAVNINNKAYIFGGVDRPNYNYSYDSVIEFDPITNSLKNVATLPQKIAGSSAVAINNKAYIFGGGHEFKFFDNIIEFDPITNSLKNVATLPQKIAGSSAVAINNKAYIFGGIDYNTCYTTILEFDPITNSLKNVATLPQKTGLSSAVVINNKAYIFGGADNYNYDNSYNSILEFDPITKVVKNVATLPQKTALSSAVVINNKAYIFGGIGVDYSYDSIIEFDPITNSLKNVATLPQKIAASSAVNINNKAYIFGGEKSWAAGSVINSIFEFQIGDYTYTYNKINSTEVK